MFDVGHINESGTQNVFKELAEMISRGSVGFFFGAGTSIHAGIPMASVVINRILASMALPIEYSEKVLKLKYPFEAFLELLRRYEPLHKMLGIFKKGYPTEFHWLVKGLVEKGLVTQLMTTNFDLLIEKTDIANLNIVYEEKHFVGLSDQSINYIKVHGCADHINSIRTVMGSIAQKKLREKRKGAVDFFFSKANLKTIFVFGYSCSDKIDLTPFINSIKGSNTKVVFIQHTPSDFAMRQKMPNENPFSVYDNIYVRCDTDSFIQYLVGLYRISTPQMFEEWSNDEYLDFSDLSIYKKCDFEAGVLFRNGNYEEALDLLRYAMGFEGDKIEYADIVSFMFEVYHNLQESRDVTMDVILPEGVSFSSLEKDMKDALKNFTHVPDVKTRWNKIAGLYTHWGHLLLSFQKYNESIIMYRKALDLLEKTSNRFRIYQCQNNIANVVFKRWDKGLSRQSEDEVFEECYKLWNNCLKYFRRSQYVFEYEISCYNLAELLFRFKKFRKSRIKSCLEKSYELAVYLNDQQGIDDCNKLFCCFNNFYESKQ